MTETIADGAATIFPIRNDADYQRTLDRIDHLMSIDRDTADENELEVLGVLVADYEDKNMQIPTASVVEAVKFYMEQNDLRQSDLAKILGARSRASEFLNGKKKLSLNQIRRLYNAWHIPAEILISES